MSNIEYIAKKVNALIKKYDTRDPFNLCENLQINIRYADLGTALNAYYFYQSRIKSIVINSRCSTIVQRILCAHELGHAVLHKELAAMHGFHEPELFDSSIPTEYEANIFAAELMVRDEELSFLLKDTNKSFFSIAKELCVPAELLDFKFKILKNKGYPLESPFVVRGDFLKKDLPENR